MRLKKDIFDIVGNYESNENDVEIYDVSNEVCLRLRANFLLLILQEINKISFHLLTSKVKLNLLYWQRYHNIYVNMYTLQYKL